MGHFFDTGIAWCTKNGSNLPGLFKLPDNGMFPAAGSDNQDFHNPSCCSKRIPAAFFLDDLMVGPGLISLLNTMLNTFYLRR
jgi:hypothetical protein